MKDSFPLAGEPPNMGSMLSPQLIGNACPFLNTSDLSFELKPLQLSLPSSVVQVQLVLLLLTLDLQLILLPLMLGL